MEGSAFCQTDFGFRELAGVKERKMLSCQRLLLQKRQKKKSQLLASIRCYTYTPTISHLQRVCFLFGLLVLDKTLKPLWIAAALADGWRRGRAWGTDCTWSFVWTLPWMPRMWRAPGCWSAGACPDGNIAWFCSRTGLCWWCTLKFGEISLAAELIEQAHATWAWSWSRRRVKSFKTTRIHCHPHFVKQQLETSHCHPGASLSQWSWRKNALASWGRAASSWCFHPCGERFGTSLQLVPWQLKQSCFGTPAKIGSAPCQDLQRQQELLASGAASTARLVWILGVVDTDRPNDSPKSPKRANPNHSFFDDDWLRGGLGSYDILWSLCLSTIDLRFATWLLMNPLVQKNSESRGCCCCLGRFCSRISVTDNSHTRCLHLSQGMAGIKLWILWRRFHFTINIAWRSCLMLFSYVWYDILCK